MNLPEKYKSPYNSKDIESSVYEKELVSGFFNPDILIEKLPQKYKDSKTWTTITPPPNANGRLHAGHALDATLKDIIGRYKRMSGFQVLMLPGTDHAGFETQVVYEKKLEKEGRSRFGMDRDQLYKEIYDFTISNKNTVQDEIKRIGASYDWSRDTFTLDEKIVSGVQDTFIKMYKDDLVYRGKRDCNWCSKHQTSLSDVETEKKEVITTFYTFKLGEFSISTSRPETKVSDEYVVVHPNDKRYEKWNHGDTFETEWVKGKTNFTVIKDESIDMEFGTGAMTITPWHSGIDFQIAKKHGLNMVQLIDDYGKYTDIAGEELKGLRAITAGRQKVVEILESKGLLISKDESYKTVVPVCYKCETPIEPQLKDQWFVKMAPLAEKALEASQTDGWERDIDTFDTWFSSGQWPLATLGFIEGEDFKRFYPTQLMETGRDLIFKWVPRMVIFGLYLAGEVPFKDIYMHGMVLDAKGQKMSKSKGNVLSPIDLADEYGMDALRMSLIVGNAPGNDIPLSSDKVKAYKKFVNKLWNIARFVLENTDENDEGEVDINNKNIENFLKTKSDLTKNIENYQLHLAGEELYQYIWHEYADIVIEEIKKDLTSENKKVLRFLFKQILIIAHPFIPFVTEEIWSDFNKSGELLLIQNWE